MCGRLNCYCRPSSYSERVAKKLQEDPPEWIDPLKFHPSPNIAPTSQVPVLLWSSGRLVVRPMKWGIPLPHVQNLVHNVRIETLSSSKFFTSLTTRKQTCAVLCDGFYEWKGKRPFFFYDKQTEFDASKIADLSENVWIQNGPPVMALAGVYHKDAESDYTCSVITREATQTSQIHHRITILLSSKDEILTWLNSELSVNSTLSLLSKIQNEHLSFYEVNDKVNSSRYQGNDCHAPKSKSGPLDRWFSQSTASDMPDTLYGKRKHSADSAASNKSRKPSPLSPTKIKSGPMDRWLSKPPK